MKEVRMFKRLLVALSGTAYTPVATRYALELAARPGTEVTGVALEDPTRIRDVGATPLGGGTAAKLLTQQREEQVEAHIAEEMARFEEACREAGVSARVLHPVGETVAELESLGRYHDLSILGLRGLFGYGVMDTPPDTVTHIIDRRISPLLAVPESYRPIRTALVATNGSPESARAMKSFVQSGLWPDAEIRVVVMNRHEEADRLLSDSVRYCRAHGHTVETEHVRCSSPREKLLEYAESTGADVVVMGSRSKTHLLRLVLGSMTSHVLAHAEIPLYLTF